MSSPRERPSTLPACEDRRWRWRVRIAAVSLAGGILFPIGAAIAAVIEPGVGRTLSSLAWPVYVFLGANLSVFTGAAAYEHVGSSRGRGGPA